MKVTFLGADHEVTGSCTLLEACGKKLLIDCGMEQGKDIYVNQELPITPGEVDGVLLTHAHIDHSGKLPLLYKQGFRGPIFLTEASGDLISIMLRDSAHIQEFEAEWRNRKGKRAGKPEYVPLYTTEDAVGAIALSVPLSYEKKKEIFPGITIRFVDAGHLLGSSSIEVWLTEGECTKKIVFSGDIGNLDQPIIKDPTYIKEADYVVMESTYGDRSHGERPDYLADLTDVIQTTLDRGGNVVIPSFAVGRTQELLYFIREIKEQGRIQGHPNFPVYVDSPLAVEATGIFNKNTEVYDEETAAVLARGENPISFPGLNTAVSAEESKAINFLQEPKVILSASGMCDAGRIKHHLKHNLWREESTILFVGYQANGTLGRAIVEGAKEVKLFQEPIEVRAQIRVLQGISGHGDNNGLMTWAKAFGPNYPKFFVNHGEDQVCEIFTQRLKTELSAEAYAPYSGDAFDLITGEQVAQGSREKIKEEERGRRNEKASGIYGRLLAAGERLLGLIRRSEGRPNKDLAKLADGIDNLCDKFQ